MVISLSENMRYLTIHSNDKSKTIFLLLAKCQGHTSHFKIPENIKFEEKKF
jgi:hypothetical protein